MSQTKKLQLIQLVWALQEFSARNCVSIPLRGISCASGERLAALAFRLRRTLAPSALALRARFSSRLRRSYFGQLPRIESLTKTKRREHGNLTNAIYMKSHNLSSSFIYMIDFFAEVRHDLNDYFQIGRTHRVVCTPLGARGAECHPWQRKNCQKSGKKSEKIGEKEEKSGRKGKNREGSFIWRSLLTDRAGYATGSVRTFCFILVLHSIKNAELGLFSVDMLYLSSSGNIFILFSYFIAL